MLSFRPQQIALSLCLCIGLLCTHSVEGQNPPSPSVRLRGDVELTGPVALVGEGLVITPTGKTARVIPPADLLLLSRPESALPADQGWLARYYADAAMSVLWLERIERSTSIWFGQVDSEYPGVRGKEFTSRFSGLLTPRVGGEYVFWLEADDAARLWIDDALLIDAWNNDPPRKRQARLTLRPGRQYRVEAHHRDAGGNAWFRLQWSGPGIAEQPIAAEYLRPDPLSPQYPAGGGHGLEVRYFAGGGASRRLVAVGRAAAVDFALPHNPLGLTPPGSSSVEFVGRAIAPSHDRYELIVEAPAGSRLHLNGKESELRYGGVLRGGGRRLMAPAVQLRAGESVDLRLQTSIDAGSPIRLLWRSQRMPVQVIPAAALAAPADAAPELILAVPSPLVSNRPVPLRVLRGGVPAGARLYLDGKPVEEMRPGDTPHTVRLDTGWRPLQVVAAGSPTVYSRAHRVYVSPADALEAPWSLEGDADQSFASQTGRSIKLTAVGERLWAANATRALVVQPFEGDFDMHARMVLPGDAPEHGLAGLILTADSSAGSPQMIVAAGNAGPAVIWQSQRDEGSDVARPEAGAAREWHLHLQRRGQRVSALASRDGQQWSLLKTVQVTAPRKVLAGLVASSGDGARPLAVEFHDVELRPGPAYTLNPPGVVLLDGSFLRGSVSRFDRRHAVLEVDSVRTNIPMSRVARIHRVLTRSDDTDRIEPGGGVLLAGGDFIHGQVRGVEEREVVVNTLLFGDRRVAMADARVVCFDDIRTTAGGFEVSTTDGNRLNVAELTIARGRLTVDLGFTTLSYSMEQIAQIRRLP